MNDGSTGCPTIIWDTGKGRQGTRISKDGFDFWRIWNPYFGHVSTGYPTIIWDTEGGRQGIGISKDGRDFKLYFDHGLSLCNISIGRYRLSLHIKDTGKARQGKEYLRIWINGCIGDSNPWISSHRCRREIGKFYPLPDLDIWIHLMRRSLKRLHNPHYTTNHK